MPMFVVFENDNQVGKHHLFFVGKTDILKSLKIY